MERHHNHRPAGPQQALGRAQASGQFVDLVIHKQAKRLEALRRRMGFRAVAAADGALDRIRQLLGGLDRRAGAFLHQSAGDPARAGLLAQEEQHVRQRGFG